MEDLCGSLADICCSASMVPAARFREGNVSSTACNWPCACSMRARAPRQCMGAANGPMLLYGGGLSHGLLRRDDRPARWDAAHPCPAYPWWICHAPAPPQRPRAASRQLLELFAQSRMLVSGRQGLQRARGAVKRVPEPLPTPLLADSRGRAQAGAPARAQTAPSLNRCRRSARRSGCCSRKTSLCALDCVLEF